MRQVGAIHLKCIGNGEVIKRDGGDNEHSARQRQRLRGHARRLASSLRKANQRHCDTTAGVLQAFTRRSVRRSGVQTQRVRPSPLAAGPKALAGECAKTARLQGLGWARGHPRRGYREAVGQCHREIFQGLSPATRRTECRGSRLLRDSWSPKGTVRQSTEHS